MDSLARRMSEYSKSLKYSVSDNYTYLDLEFVVAQSWIKEHHNWWRQWRFDFLRCKKFKIVIHDNLCSFIQFRWRNIHSQNCFELIDWFVEFEHFCQILCNEIDSHLILIWPTFFCLTALWCSHWKRIRYVYDFSINWSKECSNNNIWINLIDFPFLRMIK